MLSVSSTVWTAQLFLQKYALAFIDVFAYCLNKLWAGTKTKTKTWKMPEHDQECVLSVEISLKWDTKSREIQAWQADHTWEVNHGHYGK